MKLSEQCKFKISKLKLLEILKIIHNNFGGNLLTLLML